MRLHCKFYDLNELIEDRYVHDDKVRAVGAFSSGLTAFKS